MVACRFTGSTSWPDHAAIIGRAFTSGFAKRHRGTLRQIGTRAPAVDIDTTTEGPFAAAQYLMYGAISRLLMALFLIALGVAVSRLKMLPRWVGGSAFLLAVINLAFLPAVYFGDDAADFYSAQGWGTTASMGALWSLWTLAVSISILRSARRTTTIPQQPQEDANHALGGTATAQR